MDGEHVKIFGSQNFLSKFFCQSFLSKSFLTNTMSPTNDKNFGAMTESNHFIISGGQQMSVHLFSDKVKICIACAPQRKLDFVDLLLMLL